VNNKYEIEYAYGPRNTDYEYYERMHRVILLDKRRKNQKKFDIEIMLQTNLSIKLSFVKILGKSKVE